MTLGFMFRIFQTTMPYALPSPCPARGCRTLTTGGLCDVHRKARHQVVDSRRLSSSQRGYDAAWRKVRAWVLSQPPSGHRRADGVIVGHGPLCVFCAVETGRVTPAKDVDHIDGNSRNNAAENLRACCHACHSRRTAVDQGFARRVS